MRVLSALLVALFIASAAYAQDPTAAELRNPPKFDFSREALHRLFAERLAHEQGQPYGFIQWHVGMVEVNAFGQPVRLVYLPVLAPLTGSMPGPTRQMIDAFTMTGTPLASPPRTWATAEDRARLERERLRLAASSN
ncbi:MAG TPA: hypothetical protein VEZ11_05765 [Thermoanaerobaculia bacterium]|nr:hypothetical protein [Thermoanaerobaculia bacterium]